MTKEFLLTSCADLRNVREMGLPLRSETGSRTAFHSVEGEGAGGMGLAKKPLQDAGDSSLRSE